MLVLDQLNVSHDLLAAFCRRWRIARLSLFGSALRPDFRADSDVDVLISLRRDAEWSLWDWIEMKEELEGLFGRRVDLVEESGLKNPFRRHEILKTRQVVYVLPSE